MSDNIIINVTVGRWSKTRRKITIQVESLESKKCQPVSVEHDISIVDLLPGPPKISWSGHGMVSIEVAELTAKAIGEAARFGRLMETITEWDENIPESIL